MPKRNCGEINDEDEPPGLLSDSEDEDSDNDSIPGLESGSDSDSDEEWGEDSLRWEEDEHAHDPAPEVQNDGCGYRLPSFQGVEPGPNLADALDVDPNDPLHSFALFWPPEIFNKMLDATNSFGRLYVKRWAKDITGALLQAFLGLIIHLGLINYTGARDKLWENSWKGNKFVRSSVMPYHRFELILKAWHYVDYGQYTAEEIKENKKNDPFWPVAALETDLNDLYHLRMKPGQCLDIDEQCIPWKGRHKCRCYNKSKPVKRHFKVFSLNDSRTGYQHGFYLYRGKQEARPETVSATAYPAEKLLANEDYHNKCHILFTDN